MAHGIEVCTDELLGLEDKQMIRMVHAICGYVDRLYWFADEVYEESKKRSVKCPKCPKCPKCEKL